MDFSSFIHRSGLTGYVLLLAIFHALIPAPSHAESSHAGSVRNSVAKTSCTKAWGKHPTHATQSATTRNRQSFKVQEATLDEEPVKSCVVDPRKAYTQWQSGRVAVIDVREASEYDTYRIPDSINIPLYALKTKSFLKKSELLLVGKGPRLRPMLDACRKLVQSGFEHVAVLEGGIDAWAGVGGQLSGESGSRRNLISPREFVAAASEQRQWMVVDASSAHEEFARLFDGLVSAQWPRDSETLDRKASLVDGVLIVDDHGDDYSHAREIIESRAQHNIYYLKGGLKAYQTYVEQHAALLSRLERGPVVRAHCSGS